MSHIFNLPELDDFSEKINMDELYDKKQQNDLSKLNIFNKLLNWVSGEFMLYLQDWDNGLEIFFPSGFLSIKLLNISSDEVEFNIVVKAKNKQKAVNTNTAVINVFSHLLSQK